jgi:hypothetical protein
MEKICLHKIIEITEVNSYIFEMGWEAFQKQEECDLTKHFNDGMPQKVVCCDCGEVLEG